MLADIFFGILEIALDPFGELILELGLDALGGSFGAGELRNPDQEIPVETPSALLSGRYPPF